MHVGYHNIYVTNDKVFYHSIISAATNAAVQTDSQFTIPLFPDKQKNEVLQTKIRDLVAGASSLPDKLPRYLNFLLRALPVSCLPRYTASSVGSLPLHHTPYIMASPQHLGTIWPHPPYEDLL